MAVVAPDPRDPLLRMLKAQAISDAEMRQLLRDSAREARAIMNGAGSGGIGRDVRSAQLDVARAQQQMWRGVGQQTQVAIGDGVDAAAESVAFLTETHMAGLGMGATYYNQAVLAQGRAGIDNLISRTAAGIPLSQQVYQTSVVSGGQLDRVINAMIANGASAREIANRVYQFIDPLTPGGASYAAMRLGRTELNNAFHTTSVRLAHENPMVEAMKWNLSESHPRPDQCNDYAQSSHYRGGDAGVFRTDEVPGKPHPQCFCYVTPITLSDKEFIENFNKGKYDDYIDSKLGCSRG
jgi:hypothetical protein